MILNKKNRDTIYNEIVEQVRDGIVIKERERIIFSSSNNAYLLEGAGAGTTSIISITSIEGIRNDGFYAHPIIAFNGIDIWIEGIDFVLSGSQVATAPFTAGVIAGDTLYDYIVWQGSNKPEDGSDFYISYRYFDNNKVINPNRPISFAPGSLGGAFADAFANIVGNMYNELDNTHQQGHLQTSTGEDLELHMENYGLEKRSSTSSSGYVQIINNTGGDLDIVTSNRFVSSGFNAIIFIPQESKTIGNGDTDVVLVQSSEEGFHQNVGINAINQLFETSDLGLPVSNVSISNPGTVAGATNLFNNGANVESDSDGKARTQNAINKRGTATKLAIASAVQSLAAIRQAKVFDWEDKKSISKPDIHIFVVGETDKIIANPIILSDVGLEIQDAKSAGIQYTTVVPMGIYIDILGTVYVNRTFATQQSSIINEVSTAITNYIQNLNVGEDIVYSRLIEEGMNVSNVEKFDITSKKFSEYAFHPYDRSTVWEVYASGTDQSYAQQILKLPTGYQDVFIYDGTDTYTASGTQVTGTPSVFISIQDKNGRWVRDPQYLIDWYLSTTTTEITIDESAGNGIGVSLVQDVTPLIFDYESYENHDIDGIRVLMSGSIGSGSSSASVEISLWSGASEPTNKIVSPFAATGIVQVIEGTAEYEVMFTGTHTFDIGEANHWVVISGTETENELSGTQIFIPIETANRGAYASPTVKWNNVGSWDAITTSEKYMETVTLLQSTDKSDIDISKITSKSEIAVLNSLTLTGVIWEGDEI